MNVFFLIVFILESFLNYAAISFIATFNDNIPFIVFIPQLFISIAVGFGVYALYMGKDFRYKLLPYLSASILFFPIILFLGRHIWFSFLYSNRVLSDALMFVPVITWSTTYVNIFIGIFGFILFGVQKKKQKIAIPRNHISMILFLSFILGVLPINLLFLCLRFSRLF